MRWKSSQALVEATRADVVLLYPHVLLACFAMLALPSVTVFQRAVSVLAAVRAGPCARSPPAPPAASPSAAMVTLTRLRWSSCLPPRRGS